MYYGTFHTSRDLRFCLYILALGSLLATRIVQHYGKNRVLSEDGATVASDNIHLSTVHILKFAALNIFVVKCFVNNILFTMYQYFKGSGLATNPDPSETYLGIKREGKTIFSLPNTTSLKKKSILMTSYSH